MPAAPGRGRTPAPPACGTGRRSGCLRCCAAEESPCPGYLPGHGCPRPQAAEDFPPRRARSKAQGPTPQPTPLPVPCPRLPAPTVPDSPDIEGEIALLRSLTNRLLSTRPLDYTQINRCLRLIIRAYSAQAKAPKQLTDEEQIDNLIKKIFQDNVDRGDLDFRDLVPVRMARPGDKWWPWRMLLPLKDRWRYGLIDPDEPWPHEENQRLAESEAMQKFIAEAYVNPDLLERRPRHRRRGCPDPDDEEDPPPYDPP